MEEEIDLRPYIEALISKWYWIVGAAIVAGVVAFIVSSTLPPSYEATALVAITRPTEIVEFDTRIRSVDENQPLKAYPEIAMSDELMLALLPEVTEMNPEIQSVEVVRGMLEASAGADPSILHLTVTNGDPEETSKIANLWAELFVAKANQIYGNTGGEQLAFFQSQLDDAEVELTVAEEALIEFQAHNQSLILENQLEVLQQTQSSQLNKHQQIESILQDIQGLLAQSEVGSDYDVQLATVLLQVRAFGGGQSQRGEETTAVVPWQIQVDTTQTSDMSPFEQSAMLKGLQSVLSAQVEAVEATVSDLEPQILEVQQLKQAAETENGRLFRNYRLAEDTYTAVASKVEEERITSQDVNSGVKLVGRTAVPDEPTNIGSLMLAIIGAIAGGIVAVFGITAVFWWSSIQTITEA